MSTLVGKPAPEVTLDLVEAGKGRQTASLSDYRGNWVVLFFFPMAFTGVCGSEVVAFNKELDQFTQLGAKVLGGSTDSGPSLLAWMQHELGELNYPLFADPRKEVTRAFGVLREEAGFANRGAFIIDPEGNVAYEVVHEVRIGRSTDEILRVLKALQCGGSCEVNWGK